MLYFENKKIEESPLVKCLGECCFCNISDFFNCSDDTDKYNEMYLFSASFYIQLKNYWIIAIIIWENLLYMKM